MRKKICFVLMIFWMAVIFAFSSRNAELSTQDSTSIGRWLGRLILPVFQDMDSDMQVSFADMADRPIRKLAHVTEYAVLGLFVFGSYADRDRKKRDMICVPLLVGIAYAASDELHQMFVPGRSCELKDVLIDSCGVLLGTLIGQLAWRKLCAAEKQRKAKY